MADINKINQELVHTQDLLLPEVNPVTTSTVQESEEAEDTVSVFFGDLYKVQVDSEQAHARELLVLFLRRAVPAYESGITYISYLHNSMDYTSILITTPTSMVHTDNYIPPPPAPEDTWNGVHYPVLQLGRIYPLDYKLLITGLPLQDKQTQLVYMLPKDGVVNVGTITSPTTVLISIYNASTQPQTLLNLDLPSSFGLQFNNFVDGQVLSSKETVTYTADVLMEGQTSVNASFYINTDLGRLKFTFMVTRTDLILLNMEPNSGSYSQKLTYSTKIFTSMTQKEARKPYREKPSVSVSYSVDIYSYGLYAYAKNLALFALTHPSAVYQPLWLNGSKLTVSVDSQTSLPCNTVGTSFEVGDSIIVQNGPKNNVNLTTVTGITDTELQVSDPVTANAFADILPLFLGWTGKTSSGSYKNGKVHSHSYNVQEFNYG